MKRTIVASLLYIVVNLALNFLFVQILSMGPLGLALANSIGMWVFFLIPAFYYISGKSVFRLIKKDLEWREALQIIKIGAAGAITNAYVAVRGFIVNGLISAYVGSAGISAFTASNSLLTLFWAIPTGMQADEYQYRSRRRRQEDPDRCDENRTVPVCAVDVCGVGDADPPCGTVYADLLQKSCGSGL